MHWIRFILAHGLRVIDQLGDVVPHLVQRVLMGVVTAGLYVAVQPRVGKRWQTILASSGCSLTSAPSGITSTSAYLHLRSCSRPGSWGLVETALTASAAALVLHRVR
jgi:hypothetical protein